jgi:hypothetical protein
MVHPIFKKKKKYRHPSSKPQNEIINDIRPRFLIYYDHTTIDMGFH